MYKARKRRMIGSLDAHTPLSCIKQEFSHNFENAKQLCGNGKGNDTGVSH